MTEIEERLIEVKKEPTYFMWVHDEPNMIYVGEKEDYDNCVEIKETGWIVFTWNDESGYVFASGNTKEECLEDFRTTYLETHYEYEDEDEDDAEQVEKRNDLMVCSYEKLCEVLGSYEVDCDSSSAFALIDMSNPPERFFEGEC